MWKWARWLAVAISVGGIIYLLAWYVPDVLARRHTNPSVESAYISAFATLLGVGATAAVAIAAFWYSRSTNKATIEAAKDSTDKTVNAARDTNRAAIDAAREAQFPDRYSKAVDQLGSDNLDVRIGGIYALEGIAVDSARHHQTVMEVLAAFIREHSREQWPLPAPDDAAVPERSTRPDVQAALTVIGRRDATHDRQPVNLARACLAGVDLTGGRLSNADLSRTDLSRADLHEADLTTADLTESDLTGAQLGKADLTGALLGDAVLREADLIHANLSGAHLGGADLTGAWLAGADFSCAYFGDANLRGANLDGAFIYHADFDGADLSGADLGGADFGGEAGLAGANLAGAILPQSQPVPEGWLRDPDSGRLRAAQ